MRPNRSCPRFTPRILALATAAADLLWRIRRLLHAFLRRRVYLPLWVRERVDSDWSTRSDPTLSNPLIIAARAAEQRASGVGGRRDAEQAAAAHSRTARAATSGRVIRVDPNGSAGASVRPVRRCPGAALREANRQHHRILHRGLSRERPSGESSMSACFQLAGQARSSMRSPNQPWTRSMRLLHPQTWMARWKRQRWQQTRQSDKQRMTRSSVWNKQKQNAGTLESRPCQTRGLLQRQRGSPSSSSRDVLPFSNCPVLAPALSGAPRRLGHRS